MAGRPEVWTSVARWALVILLIGMFYVKGTTPYGHTSTTHCSCQYVTFQVVLSSVQTPSYLIIFRLLMNIYLLFRVGLWGYLSSLRCELHTVVQFIPVPLALDPGPLPSSGAILLRHWVVTCSCDLFVICLYVPDYSQLALGGCVHSLLS